MEISQPRPFTSLPNHHFFGYYAICPWNADETKFVYLESTFHNHMPKFGETAKIKLLDLEKNETSTLYETSGWNFQQGSMLHWIPGIKNTLVFNDTDGKEVYSVKYNVDTGDQTRLTRAINAVGKISPIALGVSYQRLRKCRKVVSYPCKVPKKLPLHPKNDGVFLINLETGEDQLVVSYDEIWRHQGISRPIKKFWFNHLAFSRDDSRIFFLVRNKAKKIRYSTSMWTANTDGSEPYELIPYGLQLSHFEWLEGDRIMVTYKPTGVGNYEHAIFKDKGSKIQSINPQILTFNGHPALHPSGRYFATDCYPIKGERFVYVVDLKTEDVVQVAQFHQPLKYSANLRCDPHPRWNRTGTQLCFDGLTENYNRQIFLVDFKG